MKVRGARENKLREVDLDIPKRHLTVLTGVSGYAVNGSWLTKRFQALLERAGLRIHFRFDQEAGAIQGRRVGQDIIAHNLLSDQ